ncbi:mediator of RNA polymerase II transcription subunit 15 [Drosophila kikkawai]|uniref:Mediator of RNA polymerase II transcription subunit 15 n=1 Tax=Drosophila kikkawai TaxID=30033 RepID=A0A6P4IYJ1_DROKI|nr:POU domain, class 6, transcription factor 2 [Drosophila kikkawai]
MDAKRGNASVARHGPTGGGYHASKTSMASRHAGGGCGAAIGRKQVSEVSITPSQSRNQDNPRKSPLDALSRSGLTTRNQNPFQRRSGLQDVDDSFLAANAFARPPRLRHSGLERDLQPSSGPGVTPARMSAGQEQVQQQQQQQQPPPPAQQYQQIPPAGGEQPPVAAVPSSQQLMQQYAQQPAAGQPTRHEPTPTGRAHVHQHMQQQQQQQMPQQQQQPPPVYEQQQPMAPTPDVQTQNKYPAQQPQQGYNTQPTPAASAAPPPATSSGGAGAGGTAAPPSGGAAGNNAPPDAEMCTTCPNCQTTIYLVRSPELGHGDAARPYNEI